MRCMMQQTTLHQLNWINFELVAVCHVRQMFVFNVTPDQVQKAAQYNFIWERFECVSNEKNEIVLK